MRITPIQWCHSTINPVMGCDGCELWPSVSVVIGKLVKAILPYATTSAVEEVQATVEMAARQVSHTSQLYSDREAVADAIALKLGLGIKARNHLMDVVRQSCKCYAGLLGAMRAGHPGYADYFEQPKLFPDRVAVAARWMPPSPAERAAKPWLLDLPRVIFISDMGDAFSRNISFEYLKSEVIDAVRSPEGSRHIWLWLTKRPARMAEFGQWLVDLGFQWPENLVAMTTITSQGTAGRAAELRRVPSRFKALSCEPLFSALDLDLKGIDWVIVGGGSDVLAEPFQVEWAMQLKDQCRREGAALFLKQLGKHPCYQGKPLDGMGPHGGDWNLWPHPDWKVREIPAGFKSLAVGSAELQPDAYLYMRVSRASQLNADGPDPTHPLPAAKAAISK